MWLRITLAAAFGVCAEDELHSMVPRSYLDHPHNVRHEHLCQYNRLAVSCDVIVFIFFCAAAGGTILYHVTYLSVSIGCVCLL